MVSFLSWGGELQKYLMELSDACTTMVNNVERKERNRRQS